MSDTQAGRGLIGKIWRGMNFRRLCLSALSAMLMLISPALPQQAGRVALVIGNNNYPDASTPLPSTIRDARALAEELRRSEFDVDLKENVGKADMPLNAALPRIEVDPDTFTVHIDGDVWEEQPAVELPMAQRYFLF